MCLCVAMYTCESRRQGQISWSWSCRQLWPARRECWGLKSDPLQEQYVLLVRPSLQIWIESLSNGCTLNVTPDSRYANTAAQGQGPPLTTASYFVLSLAQDPPAPVAGVTRTSDCATTASGLWNKHPAFFPEGGILLSTCHSVCVCKF